MKNKITDVRNICIEAMERLLNPEDNDAFDVEKAKAVAQLGKVVVDSAKVEVQMFQAADKAGYTFKGTGFISAEPLKIGEK
jgi:hypothetical protein